MHGLKSVPDVGRFGLKLQRVFEDVSVAFCVDGEEFIFTLTITPMESRKNSRTARCAKERCTEIVQTESGY